MALDDQIQIDNSDVDRPSMLAGMQFVPNGAQSYFFNDAKTIGVDDLVQALADFEREVKKLKAHLSPDGEYCITRADGDPMSWESLVVSNIFLELDALIGEPLKKKIKNA